jgi:1-acyl-sn-glycerol-3-phosphate acyltransferase
MHLASLYTYGELGVLSTAWLPAVAAARVTADDPTHRVPGRMLRTLARTVARASMLWRMSVEGSVPADVRRRPYVVVANHASSADPFVLSFLPMDMRFVAKEELFRVPLVGWLLRLGGDIPLRRGDRDSARAMRAACAGTLARGMSVMIFPEGTRSRTSDLGPFKSGAFQIAIDAGAPVLPVALHGTAACLDGAEPRPAQAIAEVLAPVETRGLPACAITDLRDTTREQIGHAITRRRQPVVDRYFLDCPYPAPV